MPSVSGVPPGADFVRCLYDRILDLSAGMPPEHVARINVLVPSRRMQRRLKTLFEASENLLLPRIGLVSDVSHLVPGGRQRRPVSPLRRLLDLKGVVTRLVELDDRLSASDVIDLTASLTALLDEMHGESVGFDQIEKLSPDDHSGHWAQSLSFLRAIKGYVEALAAGESDPEALHSAEVEAIVEHWATAPPAHPVILAGSTGSRATTRRLMTSIARSPRGEVILPGFDFDLPENIWTLLAKDRTHEDHPQYRFASFLKEIDLGPSQIVRRGNAPDAVRNKMISLSLRPAPVTDAWLHEGPKLDDLRGVASGLTLIEASDPKEEAAAIALCIRMALEDQQTVALITPDATLARRVAASLMRWGVRPDDSGGMPLSLSPYGRFLRHTAGLAVGEPDPVELMALLKHPMTRAGVDRGSFMRTVQEFELFLRKQKRPVVGPDAVAAFAVDNRSDHDWTDWLTTALEHAMARPSPTFAGAFEHHMRVTAAFSGDPIENGATPNDSQEKISALLDHFRSEAETPVQLEFREYVQLLERALAADSAREQDGVRPDAMIWGPLEARVQGAEVVILGGLNEGVWPAQPSPDPWLNRSMRRAAGLLLPERQIGLAAHDYQQAVAATKVVLTRSARSEGSETVPSRWLNRMTNLLGGLSNQGGDAALVEMRARGETILRSLDKQDRPEGPSEPASRPAPSPPVGMRPRRFAVTEIQRLIRDPYAIYARHVLKLRPLDPLSPEMDARQRGTVFHRILEQFYCPDAEFADPSAERTRLNQIAREVLWAVVPDPTARVEWLAQFTSNSGWLISEEMKRRDTAVPLGREIKGAYDVPGTAFALIGKADRIDRLNGGGLVIYDYKTGTPPSRTDIVRYDRQLVLEAVMAEAGAFQDIPPETVAHVSHLGVGRSPKEQITRLEKDNDTATVSGQIDLLLSATLDPEFGFMSGRAVETLRFEGDYDHLARFGEWDSSQPARREVLK